MKKIILILLCIFPLYAHSQCPKESSNEESIYDEGAEVVINPNDIGEDVRLWAQNTALKLKELLKEIKKLSLPEKRDILVQIMKECVAEAQDKRELLLMRFALNRALKLDTTFGEEDALSVNQILIPAVKQAITLYEKADLPYLEANRDKPKGEIEPPPYAAFTKSNVGYLLTASNMNKTPEGQFQILKLSTVWIANDLLRSPQARRNSANARLILKLQNLEQELKKVQTVDTRLLNRVRSILLIAALEIVKEPQAHEENIYSPSLTYIGNDNSKNPSTESTVQDSQPKIVLTLDPWVDETSPFSFEMGTGIIWQKSYPGHTQGPQGILHLEGEIQPRNDAPINFHNPTGTQLKLVKAQLDVGSGDVRRSECHLITFAGREEFCITPYIQCGPYVELYNYKANWMFNIEKTRAWNLGVGTHIGPQDSKKVNISIDAYWSGEGSVRMIHGDAVGTPEWKNAYESQNNKIVQDNTSKKLMEEDLDLNDATTIEALCRLRPTEDGKNNLLIECGGYYTASKLSLDGPRKYGKKAYKSSPYLKQVDQNIDEWGTLVSLEHRIDNKASNGTVGLRWEVDSTQLGKEIMTLFNPEEAHQMTERTDALFLYLQLNF